MPVYEFCCPVCGILEKRMKMKDFNVKKIKCDCGKIATKIPSVTTFELKGGGWYASGYSK
ncbi:MAG: Zinc ribbon domain protein [Candidatus Izimaplasma bacterium HR2]|nr:MAG: Zinc ribbon domain protein [Candidatus Izimaplasma bacterium HR2]